MLTRGILGMNKRNNIYVNEFNPSKGIRLAKDKIGTKKLLEERSIPMAKTYFHFNILKEWLRFDAGKLPLGVKCFVIKPNRGSGGEGITIVNDIRKAKRKLEKKKEHTKRYRKISFTQHIEDFGYEFFVSGKWISERELKRKVEGIFYGLYSTGGIPDSMIIEEKLIPGIGFDEFCQYGLADIRVIVFNLVPILAELRMPTEKSDGKANLAQGGIGLGVDIVSGAVNTMHREGTTYHKNFPTKRKHLENKKIPYRDEILEYSANTQYFVNSGYLGMDRVIANNGPKLLEINARAGLEIQNITEFPLLHHMKKIEDLEVNSPTKGLEISRSLFGLSKITNVKPKNTIYLSQAGKLVYLRDGKERSLPVSVEVGLEKTKNYTSKKVYKKLLGVKDIAIDTGETILKEKSGLHFEIDEGLQGNIIKLGTKSLSRYYVIPRDKAKASLKIIKPDMIDVDEVVSLKILDDRLNKITKHLNLTKILKPTNYLNEFDRFVVRNGNYDPQFTYNFPKYRTLREREDELRELDEKYRQKKYFHSKFAQLFFDKIDESYQKTQLIRAYKQQNFKAISRYNELLFGKIDEKLLKKSRKIISSHTRPLKKELGHIYTTPEIKQQLREYMKDFAVPYKIRVQSNFSRMSISSGRAITIKINSSGTIREIELQGILAHEIGIHAMRNINGGKTGRNILRSGTAHYLETEEGLAVFHAEKAIQKHLPDFKNINIYGKYILTYEAQHLSFSELYQYIYTMDHYVNPHRNFKGLFNKILKQKRGVMDTSKPGFYLKDSLYASGYEQIKKLSDETHKKLMVGKIAYEDLQYFLDKP